MTLLVGPTSITYGDSVKVSEEAPPRFCPGESGSVFAIGRVDHPDRAAKLGVDLGTIMLGVERGDGSDFEVPLACVTLE
jgi:hypothetical protein